MSDKQRTGVLVNPYNRLSDEQVRIVDGVSRDLLEDPGVLCFNQDAAEIFTRAGARSEDADGSVRLRIPPTVIDAVLASAPSRVVLGARKPAHLGRP